MDLNFAEEGGRMRRGPRPPETAPLLAVRARLRGARPAFEALPRPDSYARELKAHAHKFNQKKKGRKEGSFSAAKNHRPRAAGRGHVAVTSPGETPAAVTAPNVAPRALGSGGCCEGGAGVGIGDRRRSERGGGGSPGASNSLFVDAWTPPARRRGPLSGHTCRRHVASGPWVEPRSGREGAASGGGCRAEEG